LIVILLIIILILNFKNYFHYELDQSPFDEMHLPLLNVDSTLIHDVGHVDSNKKVVLVQVVDKNFNEYYFAILNDGRNGKYHTVLKNLDLVWDQNLGFVEFNEPIYDTSFIEFLFENKYIINGFKDNKSAFEKLKSHVFLFHDSHSDRNKISYENLIYSTHKVDTK